MVHPFTAQCNVSDDRGALQDVRNNDLVLTVEMFEHMKNYNDLLKKVHGFLKPQGKLFVHIFTHKDFAYHFEECVLSPLLLSFLCLPCNFFSVKLTASLFLLVCDVLPK